MELIQTSKKRTSLPDRSSSSSSSSSRDVYNDDIYIYPKKEVKEASLGDDLEGLIGRDPARYILLNI